MKTKETMGYKYGNEDKCKSTRELALEWWSKLNLEQQFYKVIPCLKDKNMGASERHPNSLTGREIEEIWKNELCLSAYGTNLKSTKQEDIEFIIKPENHNVKPNQKQFKEFNSELFKAYIDKFSAEDKIKALNTLVCEISTTDTKFNSLLNQISNY